MLCDIIITALSGIAGVIVGGIMSSIATQRLEYKKLLTDAYGDVIAAYTHWIEDNSAETLRLFIAAIERAKLLCPDKTGEALRELARSIVQDDKSLDDSFNIFCRFTHLARKDVRKRHRNNTKK